MPIRALLGRRLLIVEDDYFWANELRRALQDAGADVLEPVASVETALEILASQTVLDGATLDFKLRGKRAYAVADRLLDNAVPFLVVTGYDRIALPSAYAALPRLEKPASIRAVLEGIDALLPPA